MNPDQVTVVIPVYNVSEYISACVSSVIEQTYKNIEILIVDDGSRDNSVAIAEEILSNSGREYRVIHQANQGVSAARNNGIAHAKGSLVMALDADDRLKPNAIEKMVSIYAQCAAPCVVSDYAIIDKSTDFGKTDDSISVLLRTGEEACQKYFDREEIYISPAMLLSKAFLEENHIVYDEKCRFAEDDLFVWNVIAKAETIAYCNQKMYGYVFHENSTMTSATYDRFVSSYHACRRLWQKVIEPSANMRQVSNQFVFRHVFGVVHAAAKVLSFEAFSELLVQINYLEHYSQVKQVVSVKLRVLGLTPRISKKIFYLICRKL